MTESLEKLANDVSTEQSKLAGALSGAGRWFKIVLGLGGALIAGIAGGFAEGEAWPPTGPEVLVLIGSVLVFLSGVHDLINRDPPVKVLNDARLAVEAARAAHAERNEIADAAQRLNSISERLRSLYLATSSCRGYVEQFTDQADVELNKGLADIINTCATDLKVALGFILGEYWTVCIYQTERDDEGLYLRCVAGDRAVSCDISAARTWREGIGVGGIALARKDEVTVPDIQDPAVGAALMAPNGQRQAQDGERYRSMCAVPILVGNVSAPWGVVLATSSNAGHFGSEYGVDPVEPVRMLAGFCALLVLIHGKLDSSMEVTA